MSSAGGEVIDIEQKDAIPVGGVPVKVCVNVDLSMPMRRGVKCSTNAGVTKWQQYIFDRQPKSICIECYIVNHSKKACPAATLFLKKAPEKPYFVGKVNNIRKNISIVAALSDYVTIKTPTIKKSRKIFVKYKVFIPPKDGEIINLDSLIIHEETSPEEDGRLGKRHRADEADQHTSSNSETPTHSNIMIPASASINTQLITTIR